MLGWEAENNADLQEMFCFCSLWPWRQTRGLGSNNTHKTYFSWETLDKHRSVFAPRRTLRLLKFDSGLKHSLTLGANVELFSALGAGVGILSSLDTSSNWGVTVDMSSLLSTGCPIDPNITIQAQSSPATQLAFPHGMAGGEQSLDYAGSLQEETGVERSTRLMIWAPIYFISCSRTSSWLIRIRWFWRCNRRSYSNRTNGKHLTHLWVQHALVNVFRIILTVQLSAQQSTTTRL